MFSAVWSAVSPLSFNRTSMELKHPEVDEDPTYFDQLLIEPVWN